MITRSKQMAEDSGLRMRSKRVNEQLSIFTPPHNIVLTVNAMLDANKKCICY